MKMTRQEFIGAPGASCGMFSVGPGTYFVPPKGTANVTAPATRRSGAVKKTVAFLGGSITEMNGFRPCVMKALREKYPQMDFVELAVEVCVENMI